MEYNSNIFIKGKRGMHKMLGNEIIHTSKDKPPLMWSTVQWRPNTI